MKVEINMIGGGIQHTDCSSAFNKNNFIEWKKDESANISFHIDDGLYRKPNIYKKNFGWLLESSAIIPNIINDILSNIDFYKKNYELIFTHDRRIIDKHPDLFKFCIPNATPWIQNKKIYEKNKNISFIGSNKTMCNGHTFRQQMIEKFKDKADHYGRGFHNKELPWFYIENNIEETGKLIGLKNYMFSVAMENDDYNDIFTEKITDCFATGTLPIFWGTKNIGNYFDKDGIIFLDNFNLDDLNFDFYFSKFRNIKNNFEICYNMQTAEDYIFLNYIK